MINCFEKQHLKQATQGYLDVKTIPEKLDIIYFILEFIRTKKRKLKEQRVNPNATDLQIHFIHRLIDREEEVCTELEALLDE